MSRTTTHRSSEVEYNGKLLQAYSFGLVSANATTRFGRVVAPCDGKFVDLVLGTIATPTNAAAVLRVGLSTDTDYFLDDKNIQNQAVGSVSLIGDALFVQKDVTRGDIIVFEFTNADTTGEIAVTAIIEPR